MNTLAHRFLTFISILCVIILLLPASVAATSDDLTDADRETFLNNISLTLLSAEPEKDKICCFDVNIDNLIAVGTTGSEGARILIYSADGAFQYGYSFQCHQRFAVSWDSGNIAIYFVRSDIVAKFDRNGNNISLTSVEADPQSGDFWSGKITATQCTANGKTYRIQTGIGILGLVATGYSQLVVIDSRGQENIIYDISSRYRVVVLLCLVAVLLLTAFVVRMIIRGISKKNS